MSTFAGSGVHFLGDLGCEYKSPAVSFHLRANYHECFSMQKFAFKVKWGPFSILMYEIPSFLPELLHQ